MTMQNFEHLVILNVPNGLVRLAFTNGAQVSHQLAEADVVRELINVG
jgi:hypothetical protein